MYTVADYIADRLAELHIKDVLGSRVISTWSSWITLRGMMRCTGSATPMSSTRATRLTGTRE